MPARQMKKFFRQRLGTRERIISFLFSKILDICSENARVVELVDTYVSEAYAERCAGSSPVPGTYFFVEIFLSLLMIFYLPSGSIRQ